MNNSILALMNLEAELVLKAEHDHCDESNSPREWDNLGTMITWQSCYNSPDENDFSEPSEFFASILGETVEGRIYENNNNNSSYIEEIIKRFDKKGYVMLPVYCYEHGNVLYRTGSFSCPWDSGMVGVIFASKKKIYEEYGVKRMTSAIREKVETLFQDECATYTQWANGEVCGFVLEDLQGEHVDSCWGFYDDFSDKDILLKIVSEHAELGNIDDWQKHDENVVSENFKLVRI